MFLHTPHPEYSIVSTGNKVIKEFFPPTFSLIYKSNYTLLSMGGLPWQTRCWIDLPLVLHCWPGPARSGQEQQEDSQKGQAVGGHAGWWGLLAAIVEGGQAGSLIWEAGEALAALFLLPGHPQQVSSTVSAYFFFYPNGFFNLNTPLYF